MGYLAITGQLISNASHCIDGDGEPKTLGIANDGCVDTNDLSLLVQEGATGVARIDRCIRLQEADSLIGDAHLAAGSPCSTENANRDGVIQTQGIPNGDRPFPWLEAIGVTQLHRRQICGFNIHHPFGIAPNTDLFRGQLDLDDEGYIRVDAQQRTSLPDVYAAGDVCRPVCWSVATAVGHGANAIKAIKLS